MRMIMLVSALALSALVVSRPLVANAQGLGEAPPPPAHGEVAPNQAPEVVTNTVFVTNPPPVFSGPAGDLLTFATGASSNWAFCAYGIASTDGKKFGGGLAGMYKLNDFIAPVLRVDYYDGRVWMPSASLNLQAPITLFGKFTAIPFVFTGLATPLSGKGSDNFSAVGMAGAGLAIRISDRFDLVYDLEKWSGFAKEQHRAGVLFKLAKW